MPPAPVPGSVVWLRQRRWRVDSTRVDRRTVRLDVSHRAGRLTVFTPYDRPRALSPDHRPIRVRRQQGCARLAFLAGSVRSARLAHAAVDGRLEIWPHQLEPVMAILDGQRRLLIADDVGLGKTVQAGLILAETQAREPGARSLVVTPAALRAQWAEELQERFGLESLSADAALDEAVANAPRHANPWQRPGVWLVSIDYLKQPHVLNSLPMAAWDVVVIDEAHIASGHSDRHKACDELGRRARRFVLLSATPHDGDTLRFARLLKLGALPFAGDTLAVFRRTREDIALPRRRLVRWTRTRASPELVRVLDALQAFERTVLRPTRGASNDGALLLLSVFRRRALSTMAALDRSLARRLEWLESGGRAEQPTWQQSSLAFEAFEADDDITTELTAEMGIPRIQERSWLRRLRDLAAAAMATDGKIARLRACATRTTEPFVLFTEFRDSLDASRRAIETLRSVATIHGGQTDAVRRQELVRFLTGTASVLLATDAGGQGLNLQSRARWVVNLELPWNPTRLEQRIGRVDRMGQQRRVHATLLMTEHPAEGGLVRALARRTLTARRDLGPATLCDLVPPDPLSVASAMIRGTPPPALTPTVTTIPPCVRYQRRARAHAVVAKRRRALHERWRGGRRSGRPVLSPVALRSLPRGVDVIVVSGQILDGTGAEVERRLLALAVPAGEKRTMLAEQCLRLLHAHLRRRLRRLQPVLADVAARRLASERAVAWHLHTLSHPDQVQLGLFSQREATAFRAAQERFIAGATAAADRIRLEEERARLDTAAGTVEWIGEHR